MAILFQINIVSNMLSTGKICEDIAKVAKSKGWETYIAYGRWAKESISKSRRIGSAFDMYEHYVEHRLFDNEGLASRRATNRLVRWINEVKPDIIQLHNIHDHYLNYPILFRYLATIDTPIVWTQHDCWAFTGGCTYFDLYNCGNWKESCKRCPEKRAFLCKKSNFQFNLKKDLLSRVKYLSFVSVSDWLGTLVKQSFYKNRDIVTIHNGVDITHFKPSETRPSDGKFRILGVAAVWHKRKGFDDFLALRSVLPSDFEITLVGLSQKQLAALPYGIIGITRTSSIDEMVKLYGNADVFVNPTYSDNFPTTNIEALACGTPVVTYRTGGSPEAIDENTGVIVEQGDIGVLADVIKQLRNNPLSRELCRMRAERYFDKEKCFSKYIDLYDSLLKSK